MYSDPDDPVAFAPQGNFATIPTIGSLIVSGPVGQFSIVNESTQEVVGSGVSSSNWELVTVDFDAELVPGQRHLIVSPGIEPSVFTPTVRHGTAMEENGFRVRFGVVPRATLNEEAFGVNTRFYRNSAPAPVSTYASLWISARDVNGNDPVTPTPPVPPGQPAFLTPIATIDFLAEFDAGEKKSGNGIRLGVPDEPALAGVVLLFQFASLTPDGQRFVVSDVFGTTVMTPDHEKKAAGGYEPRTWATMSSEERDEAMTACRRWLGTSSKRIRGQRSVHETIMSMR